MASNDDETPLDSHESRQTALPRRRNGKQQSCEPCRLAKAACDHQLPKCGRCTRRGIEERCTYHPAPMTKIPGASKIHKRTDDPNGRSPLTGKPEYHLLQLLSDQCSTHTEPGEGGSLALASPNSTEPQYLGSTSYSAVFQENQESLGKDWEQAHSRVLVAPVVTDTHLNSAVFVLKALPDRQIGEMLIDSHFDGSTFRLHEPTTRYCFHSLWDTFGDALIERDRPDSNALRKMAQQLLQSTYNPLNPSRTAAEWLQSHTGERIRFEVIGSLLSILGLAIPSLPEGHSLFQEASPRQLMYRFGKAAETCQELCSFISISNEFTLYLHYHVQLVQSLYSGDDSGFFWRKSAHVATTITALGFHRESTVMNQTPFMVAEIRKRMFTAAFIVDKQLATLVGRPPRISKRYSNCKLPLDLNDDEIMLQNDALSQKRASLDANGWNTEGEITRMACLRAAMIATQIRDEILELCHGPESECTAAKRNEIRIKSQRAFEALPQQLQYRRAQDLSTMAPVKRNGIISLKLEFLMNQYLLDRLPTEDAQENKQALVDTASEMLEILLINNDIPTGPLVRSSTKLICFGIPSASVLAVELLRQQHHSRRYSISLPRAKIIQNLSVFNHSLKTMSPINGNYVTCSRTHKVIQKILDQILEAVPCHDLTEAENGHGAMQLTPIEPNGNQELTPPTMDIDLPAIVGPFDDTEFAEWFNAVDWNRGPWTFAP